MEPTTVLLVDDSASQRAVIAHRLQQIGYAVASATDGLDCLRKLAEVRPDIVLLDVVMPGLDGWETLDRIRESSSVPVIMLTARAEEVERVRGLRAGADDYVGKPFHPDELEARIEAVLRRAHAGRRDALTGLGNRRAFDEHLDGLLARGGTFALVLFDVDDFKGINDTLGHQAGDRVLQTVGRIALPELRSGEQLFRTGGDEFAVIVIGDGAAAWAVARRIQSVAAAQETAFRLPTLSAGVAVHPGDGTTKEAFVEAADRALYEVKRAGKNGVAAA
jgi:diguanylate cyclase (GGDEF)-like protein